MKNNNVTNPPEIKRNLFKLTKKCKNGINKLIQKNNNQIKSVNEEKLKIKKNSHKINNYYKLNSFLSEESPLQNIINQINIENNYITNINTGQDDNLLSDRTSKNILNKMKMKNENRTLNLSKNVEEIIKKRITQTKIQKIKNKVKKINHNKKPKLSNSRTITLKELKKSSPINNKANSKRKKERKKNNKNKIINMKERNQNEKSALNDSNKEKINKKYLETRRLSIDWGKEENKDFEKLANKIINNEKMNNIDNKQKSTNSKVNLSLEENDNKYNKENSKILSNKENLVKNNNYDFDSIYGEDIKSPKNISIINSNENSNNKHQNLKNNRDDNLSLENINTHPLFISISNFKDKIKNINEENKINLSQEQAKNEDNNKEKENIKNKKNISPEIERINNNKENTNTNKDISKLKKDKLEIENIQKIISNTVESLNINFNNQNKTNHDINIKSHEQKQKLFKMNSDSNSIIVNKKIYAPKKITNQFPPIIHTNQNISGKTTYYKKILPSRTKNNLFSYEKIKNNYTNKTENLNKLNMSYEEIKFAKIKNLLNDDMKDNNNSDDGLVIS